jgi:hypothetical protein
MGLRVIYIFNLSGHYHSDSVKDHMPPGSSSKLD